MTESTFVNVTREAVRNIVPAKSFLPAWTKFTVKVTIPDMGQAYISLFDRYIFPVSHKKALKAIGALVR